MGDVMTRIEQLVPTLHGWCSVEKAQTFAAVILALRPRTTVEIGVWGGRGSLSMGLAHASVGTGRVIAIDPWEASASVEGQINDTDRAWWGAVDHDAIRRGFLMEIERQGLVGFVDVVRRRSRDAEAPDNVGLLVVDGNHGEESIDDVKRFAPSIYVGGFCYLDDVDWTGGSVRRASVLLESLGFRRRYVMDTGEMYQRVKAE